MIRSDMGMARAVTALAAAALIGACAEDPDIITSPTPSGGERFASYVALGNSITAGYQSGGINDSTQQQSYAKLFAAAAGAAYVYPSLAKPGCPPPVDNFQTQTRVGGAAAPPCALRTSGSGAVALNNVAVPGATAVDLLATTSASSNALTTFILGGRSQVERALMAGPTFVSVWMGNNDVLAAGVSGILVPLAGVSPGLTPAADFTASYDAGIDSLVRGAPGLEGVLIGVVNVTNAPVLFPVQALFNPAFKAGFDAFTGATSPADATVIHPSCTPTTTALISFQIVSQIRLYRANPATGHPPVIACAPGAVPGTPVGDIFVLDAAEIATVTTTVAAYNAGIQAKAAALGFAYYDPNPTLLAARADPTQISTVPNLASATAPFGTWMSLDGAHPRLPAHQAVANGIITAVNATYGTTIPAIP